MSQMFIGIIGIVVVIGLAIAGAVYFGDQFQQSRTKSRAAAAVAATSQVANAATLLYTNDGIQPVAAANVNALVNGGYLTSAPTNPIVPTNPPRLVTAGGLATGPAQVAVLDLGPGAAGSSADLTCQQIAIQTGQAQPGDATPTAAAALPINVSGCFRAVTGAGAGLTVGNHYAYTRI